MRLFRLENRRLRINNMNKYLMGGCKQDRVRLFSVMPSNSTRGIKHKL